VNRNGASLPATRAREHCVQRFNGAGLDQRLRAGVRSFQECLGRAPSGFVAPGWLYNEELVPVLERLNIGLTESHFDVFDGPVSELHSNERGLMADTGHVGSPGVVHPLIEKARASAVPIADLIGFRIEDIGAGRAVSLLHAGPQHANPMGTLHGGVLCDLADAAMGMAFASTLAPDESFTTMALSINFFRPVWQTLLRAEARVVNRGKNVGYVECEVTSQDGKSVAKATSTCVVLRGKQAAMR
jgi:uncharacterized protein (TIGR00369 family)